MALTSSPTLYASQQSTVNDQSDTSHWDGAYANNVRTASINVHEHFPRTQTVVFKSSGNTIITVVAQHYAPTAALAFANSTTGRSVLQASGYRMSTAASTAVTIVHGTNGANWTGKVTLLYT